MLNLNFYFFLLKLKLHWILELFKKILLCHKTPPNVLCPVPFMGLTMQPCEKLRWAWFLIFFSFFDFVYALNLKNTCYFSMSDGMLVVNAIFVRWDDLRSKPMLWNEMFAENIGDYYMWIIFNLNKFLSKVFFFFFVWQNEIFKIQ
jgi:hypothetical protein